MNSRPVESWIFGPPPAVLLIHPETVLLDDAPSGGAQRFGRVFYSHVMCTLCFELFSSPPPFSFPALPVTVLGRPFKALPADETCFGSTGSFVPLFPQTPPQTFFPDVLIGRRFRFSFLCFFSIFLLL